MQTPPSMSQPTDAICLSVNLNKIALIRNSREGNYPNVKTFAEKAIALGVNGLTVHPRPDQRHIIPRDVRELSLLCKNNDTVEFNIEGNPFAHAIDDYPGLMALVEETRPEQCTLVPDSNDQKTSDHGFDLLTDSDSLKPYIAQLKSMNVRICLFMDPNKAQIEQAKHLGADRIELYTGPYAEAYATDRLHAEKLFQEYYSAAEFALSIGLGVNAGHDLNLENMQEFKSIPGLAEVSIGHALTVDALHMGYEQAIQAYLNICKR